MGTKSTIDASYWNAVLPLLPRELAQSLQGYASSSESAQDLDTLIRFVTGGSYSESCTAAIKGEWASKQRSVIQTLDSLSGAQSSGVNAGDKRSRANDTESDAPDAKRAKASPPAEPTRYKRADDTADPPLYLLPALSVTSPLRKKLEICIHKSSIKFTNPTNGALEFSLPRSEIRRAFLVPTRGKKKPHNTVVLLSYDAPPSGRNSTNNQVIFGCDDEIPRAGTFGVTECEKDAVKTYDNTRDALLHWLDQLGLPLLEPTQDVFKSATQGKGPKGEGVPGIEAYRSAKQGTLWFMKEGILWGEGKPCEFWALEDLLSAKDALTIIGGTGRTCSLILPRKLTRAAGEDAGSEDERGIESEFSVIDSREQEPVNAWIRRYRHLFGKPKAGNAGPGEASGSGAGKGAAGTAPAQDDDDEESDFEYDSDESDGGSPSASSGSEGDAVDVEEDAAESGAENDDDAEGELDPKHHPLMRPGAMPRMSRAAMDMVVDMVEQDLVGSGGESEDEDDELDG